MKKDKKITTENMLAHELVFGYGEDVKHTIDELHAKELVDGDIDVWDFVQREMADVTKAVVGYVEDIVKDLKEQEVADIERELEEHGHYCYGCDDCDGGFVELSKDLKRLKKELADE